MDTTLYTLKADPSITAYQLAQILEVSGYCLNKEMLDKLPEDIQAYFVPDKEKTR